MQDAPALDELLRVARLTLLERVLPCATPEVNREIRMVASVLAIAQRAAMEQPHSWAEERRRLIALYPADAELPDAALDRKLAAEARGWQFGSAPERQALILAHLRECTAEKLRENNPRALQATG